MQIAGADNLRAPKEISPQQQAEKLGQTFQDVLRAQVQIRADRVAVPPVSGPIHNFQSAARRPDRGARRS